VTAQSLPYAPYSAHPGHLVLAAVELSTEPIRGGSKVESVDFMLTKDGGSVAILSASITESEPVSSIKLSAVYVAGGQPCGSCR
jgi:cytidine deaminase